MSYTSKSPYFVYTQTMKRFSVVWSVYNTLSHYCNSFPIMSISTRNGVKHPFLMVLTRSYPYLLSLYELFYVKVDGKVNKCINYELLTHLDDIALAYWAIDDGSKVTQGSGFYLHTKAFTFSEAYKLAGMLHYQFGLVCTVQSHKNTPVIYIRAQSMKLFRSIVTPHFLPEMSYKLT